MKKIITLLLALSMIICLLPATFAADETAEKSNVTVIYNMQLADVATSTAKNVGEATKIVIWVHEITKCFLNSHLGCSGIN